MEAGKLPMKFDTFSIEYILHSYLPPKPKKRMTDLELEKQLALFPHSYILPITCILSFLIPLYLAFLVLFPSYYIVFTRIFVYMYTYIIG